MLRASLVPQRLKHLPAMREMWVRSLGQEDPLVGKEEEETTVVPILSTLLPSTVPVLDPSDQLGSKDIKCRSSEMNNLEVLNCAVLSSMMKSCTVLPCLSVQHNPASHRLLSSILVISSTAAVLQCLRSSHPYSTS